MQGLVPGPAVQDGCLHRFYGLGVNLYPLFALRSPHFRIDGIRRFLMDIVFLACVALLWGVMVLLVAGFRRLERPQGGRP